MLKSKSKERRQNPAINAGSMADIAFLLLIFFLVSTQLFQEKAMKVKLPPWSEGKVEQGKTTKAIFGIKVNAKGEILADGNVVELESLKSTIKSFILFPVSKFGKEKRSDQVVISLQHDAKTSYGNYLKVYDELQLAYREIHQEKAILKYKSELQDLSPKEYKSILKQYPIVISEAEPFQAESL